MNRSTSRIVAVVCALLLAQLVTGSAEAQQESSAVPEAPKPGLSDSVSHGAALSDVIAESFAGRQQGPVPKTPGHGAGSEAGGPSCGDDACEEGEDECNCPQDCPGVCPCVLFDNKAEFVAFAEGAGTTLASLETFEESILPPAEVALMDDTLRGGVPNLPYGFPFVNGMDVLGLCVQSNDLGGAPDDKSPRGVEGLAAASSGFSGAISDVVVASMFEDSLDLLIIEPGYLGVGFDTISFQGGDMTEIRVYARDNTTMFVAGISSADAIGSNFFGVFCSEQIGRINIFDTGGGAEGGDNIQMWGFFGPAECGNGVCEAGESCGAPKDPPPVCVEDCGTCALGGAVNDDCQDAIPIFDGPTDYDTTGTSTDGLGHGACQFCGQTWFDIWYQYEATCTGDLTVSTCGTAQYDTDLVVYAGRHPDDWTCPPGDAELLGCNDDAEGCDGFTSEVTVPVTAGNWYTIRVGGWNDGDQGSGTVTLTCAGLCGDETCDEGEDECNCPEDCPGQCPCEIFTDALEFEVFITALGNSRISMENFEESELPPATFDLLDDPLCGGVPNLPDGFPFPNGLGALSLCLQSNEDHAPADPNSRGTDGLVAVSAGVGGAVSDVVVANTFVDSLDLILVDIHHIGVGFNPITLLGGASVELQVFDKNNELMLVWQSPADETGASFWGISCSEIIDRVNIYDPSDGGSDGSEGADNIELWVHGDPCGACPTDVDGSGTTGAFDLAFLLGNWGPVTPESQCIDADDNGFIDAFDLAVLLGAWGSCA